MNQKNKDTLDKTLIKLVQEKKPANVQQLVDLTKSEISFIPEQKILQHILRLESQGKITLEPLTQTPPKLSTYLKTPEATWYWITIFLATTTALIIFIIPENSPLIYLRQVLGAIFVVFLPGYSLIKALFPEKNLDTIERIVLSLGMSLALVPVTGLMLNYTPWGIRTIPITLSLLTLTIIFATVAIIREHQTKKQSQ
ncbi:MAG: DUF1616 domain-containing protein [Candidatus Bathyarchaeota archaeon]|jgi:hypothetical protein